MKRVVLAFGVFTVVAVVAGCSKSGGGSSSSSSSTTTGATTTIQDTKGEIGTWKAIPNIKGLVADVPATAEPNGLGGAAGFHPSDKNDKSFAFTLYEASSAEVTKDIKAEKASVEQFMFKKWISAVEAPDGWALQWESSKPTGADFQFRVRRKIDGKAYNCNGSVSTQAALANAVKSCQTIKKA